MFTFRNLRPLGPTLGITRGLADAYCPWGPPWVALGGLRGLTAPGADPEYNYGAPRCLLPLGLTLGMTSGLVGAYCP